MVAVAAPRSLKDIEDLGAGSVFPGSVLEGSETALCLFSAAWHGRQDAYWVARRGLTATCVDLDARRLEEMREIYPPDWEFVHADAFEYVRERVMYADRVDAVILDPYTVHFAACAAYLPEWCDAANNVVILGMDGRELEPPPGWELQLKLKRSSYKGGVYWQVLGSD